MFNLFFGFFSGFVSSGPNRGVIHRNYFANRLYTFLSISAHWLHFFLAVTVHNLIRRLRRWAQILSGSGVGDWPDSLHFSEDIANASSCSGPTSWWVWNFHATIAFFSEDPLKSVQSADKLLRGCGSHRHRVRLRDFLVLQIAARVIAPGKRKKPPQPGGRDGSFCCGWEPALGY